MYIHCLIIIVLKFTRNRIFGVNLRYKALGVSGNNLEADTRHWYLLLRRTACYCLHKIAALSFVRSHSSGQVAARAAVVLSLETR